VSLTRILDARYKPDGAAGAAGMDNATSGSTTDQMTRTHRMTLDEARLILNVKATDAPERAAAQFEHLMKANSPPAPPATPAAAPKGRTRASGPPAHSHYLQSKVVRAIERLRAEEEAAAQAQAGVADAAAAETAAGQPGVTTGAATGHAPPPPPPGAGPL
jgi:import inner membrane translocase subunit TIM16